MTMPTAQEIADPQLAETLVQKDRDLDRLAEIAAALCSAPVAYVAAFEGETQWFRACVGMDVGPTIPMSSALCNTVVDARTAIVIPDLLFDPRTGNRPVVIENGLRFYAGHPVTNPQGEVVGSVCVIDVKPRPEGLNHSEALGLSALADQAAAIFELRRTAERRDEMLNQHRLQSHEDRRRIARLSALVSLGDRLREAVTDQQAFGIGAETLGLALDVLQAGYAQIDATTRMATVEHDWSRDASVTSSNGRHRFEDHPGVFDELEEDRPVQICKSMLNDDVVRSHLNAPVIVGGRLVGMVYAIDHEKRQWSNDDIQFARGVADRIHAAVERLHVQEDRDVMAGEIGHRLKNLMAITRAIAMQTLTGRADVDVVRDLDERLAAYSGAHDVLLAGSGDEAGLLQTAQMVTSRLSASDTVTMEGPPIMLNERSTMALSLLVNELVTNAMKHGSLSRRDGKAHLSWSIEQGRLLMKWMERGGPPAIAPVRRGFGTRILEIGLHRVGGTQLDYAREGLTATFSAPIAHLTIKG